jgi:diphthamide biosynthesis protein 4
MKIKISDRSLADNHPITEHTRDPATPLTELQPRCRPPFSTRNVLAPHPPQDAMAADGAATESPYEVLGVSKLATADELRHAYQRLIRQHHPDKSGSTSTDEAFVRVQRAYDELRDPTHRLRHDAEERAAALDAAGDLAREVEVDLSELRYEEEEGRGVWSYDCACGDVFVLREAQLDAGIERLHCSSCSFILRPLYTAAEPST